jgi:hypothetical protein
MDAIACGMSLMGYGNNGDNAPAASGVGNGWRSETASLTVASLVAMATRTKLLAEMIVRSNEEEGSRRRQ